MNPVPTGVMLRAERNRQVMRRTLAQAALLDDVVRLRGSWPIAKVLTQHAAKFGHAAHVLLLEGVRFAHGDHPSGK